MDVWMTCIKDDLDEAAGSPQYQRDCVALIEHMLENLIILFDRVCHLIVQPSKKKWSLLDSCSVHMSAHLDGGLLACR